MTATRSSGALSTASRANPKVCSAAGLNPARVGEYYEIQGVVDRLSYAQNEAARRYLNGEIDRKGASEWLTRLALMSPPRAEQRTRFMDDYRSYVINYNLGKDLVRQHVEARAGAGADATLIGLLIVVGLAVRAVREAHCGGARGPCARAVAHQGLARGRARLVHVEQIADLVV